MTLAPQDSIWPVALMALGALAALLVALRFRYRYSPSTIGRCRACGYDVSQRPPESDRCSECGADLAAPLAIVTRDRQLRWPVLMLGLATAIVLFCMTLDTGRRFNWARWYYATLPDRVVIWRARDSASPEPYLAVWASRNVRISELIDLLIDRYATNPATFDRVLFDSVFGQSTDAQKKRYVDLVLRELTGSLTPSKMRQGAGMLLKIESSDPLSKFVGIGPVEVELNGTTRTRFATGTHAVGSRLQARLGLLEPLGDDGVEPGTYELKISFTLTCRDVHSVPVQRVFPIKVFPADYAQGTAVELTEVEARLLADHLRIVVFRSTEVFTVRVYSDREPLNAPLALRVDMLGAKGQRTIGWLSSQDSYRSPFAYIPLDELTSDGTFTLLLQGDPRALDVNRDDTRYWPGKIIFEGITLPTSLSRGDAPTTRPYRIEMPTTRPVLPQ